MSGVRFSEDRYGFTWGPLTVERVMSFPKAKRRPHVVIILKTDRQLLQIRVTPAGFIRVGEIEKRKS